MTRKVIFREDDVPVGEAVISTERLATAGIIQVSDSFFTFSRFDSGDVIFQRVDLLVLDDEEVTFY